MSTKNENAPEISKNVSDSVDKYLTQPSKVPQILELYSLLFPAKKCYRSSELDEVEKLLLPYFPIWKDHNKFNEFHLTRLIKFFAQFAKQSSSIQPFSDPPISIFLPTTCRLKN